MPFVVQSFNIAVDIPSQKVNTSTLEAEILENPEIETALRHCVVSGGILILTWNATPTPQTISVLTGDTTAPCGGILGNHQGLPPAEQPRDPSGAPIVAPTFSNSQGNDPQWPGWKYVPTASDGNTPVLSVFDQQITIERKIHSGSYRVIPPTDGGEVPTDDVIEFSVVDKDDILGLFGELGLTVGVDVLELKKWVINEHVDGNVRNQRDFYGEEVFPITQGLYVRTGYTSTGAHVPTLFVTLKDYIE